MRRRGQCRRSVIAVLGTDVKGRSECVKVRTVPPLCDDDTRYEHKGAFRTCEDVEVR
jgi:hypothetical protein